MRLPSFHLLSQIGNDLLNRYIFTRKSKNPSLIIVIFFLPLIFYLTFSLVVSFYKTYPPGYCTHPKNIVHSSMIFDGHKTINYDACPIDISLLGPPSTTPIENRNSVPYLKPLPFSYEDLDFVIRDELGECLSQYSFNNTIMMTRIDPSQAQQVQNAIHLQSSHTGPAKLLVTLIQKPNSSYSIDDLPGINLCNFSSLYSTPFTFHVQDFVPLFNIVARGFSILYVHNHTLFSSPPNEFLFAPRHSACDSIISVSQTHDKTDPLHRISYHFLYLKSSYGSLKLLRNSIYGPFSSFIPRWIRSKCLMKCLAPSSAIAVHHGSGSVATILSE